MLSLGIGLTSVPVLARRGPAYDPYAAALFARLPATPSALRRRLINDLIVNLRDHAVFETKDDALYVTATGMDDPGYTTANDAFFARRNFIKDAYNLTAVGSPAFTADRGYAGDGIGAYLDTGFNAATAIGAKCTQNSAHVSAWNRTSRAAANVSVMGARQGTANYIDIVPVAAGNIYVGRLQTGNTGSTIGNVQSAGHFAVNRPSSTDIQLYRNGSLLQTDARASVTPPNASVVLLARALSGGSPDSFASDQLIMGSIGASLSGPEHAAFTSALNTYSTAVGAV